MPPMPDKTIKYIMNEFFKLLSMYTIEEHKKDESHSFFILDDSLVLSIKIIEYKRDPSLETKAQDRVYNYIEILELTYNEIGFKYNHQAFCRRIGKVLGIDYLQFSVTYMRFKGYNRLYWCMEEESDVEYYNRIMPELKLRERYETWPGVKYNFIVFEMEGSDSSIEQFCLTTTAKSSTVVQEYCQDKFNKKATKREIAYWKNQKSFWRNFYSWETESNQSRIENHLKYFVLEECYREKEDAWNRQKEIKKLLENGGFTDVERGTYLKPTNRWRSEELVYNIIRDGFKKVRVIYQHRPFFLRSPIGGQMSYDVFIPKLNIAIEYQGKQHFEPVNYFGGEVNFQQTRMRDLEKKRLSIEHGIMIGYVNYWEDITRNLVIDRVKSLMTEACNPQESDTKSGSMPQKGIDPDDPNAMSSAAVMSPARKSAPWYYWLPGVVVFSVITTLWGRQDDNAGHAVARFLAYVLPAQSGMEV